MFGIRLKNLLSKKEKNIWLITNYTWNFIRNYMDYNSFRYLFLIAIPSFALLYSMEEVLEHN